MTEREAVLFISFGGPEKSEDIMPFLEIVTRGRGIPRERLLGVAEHYEHIGGKSPINEITRRQAQLLREAMALAGDQRSVYLAQRNWTPFIEEVLRCMSEDGITQAVAFCTAAYRSEASLERYVVAVNEAREKIGSGAPTVQFVGPWFDHPRFIDAICARVRECVVPESASWVFTAHSIPCCLAKESTYVEELRQTASLVAAQLGRKDWTLAFTSRSGNPRDPWLEPDISKLIAEVAGRGVRDLFAIPIGFVADHVEVLYDLDIEAKAASDKAGVHLHRAKTVGDHPLFIKMIADMVCLPDVDQALATNSMNSRFQDGRKISKVGRLSKTCFCFPSADLPPCQIPPALAVGRQK